MRLERDAARSSRQSVEVKLHQAEKDYAAEVKAHSLTLQDAKRARESQTLANQRVRDANAEIATLRRELDTWGEALARG